MRRSILLAAAVAAVSIPMSAQAATIVASYLFQNTLSSSVAGAPALVATDPTGTSGFVSDTVGGSTRTVYHVGGTNANSDQGGLTFNSTGLLPTDSYSVALTIKFFDRENAWRRILDVKNRTSDEGFYVDPSNNLDVFPVAGNAAFTNDIYQNVVLTVKPSGPNNVNAYIQGGMTLAVTTDILFLQPGGLINLFLDNVAEGGQGEWSQANIAVVNFYSGVLTADEVAVINGDPTAPPAPAVPEPSTWGTMLLGFGMIGFAARRRRLMATRTA